MATNQQILDKASYELGYIEYGASLDATDSADALDALNEMMHGWRYSDKDFNWFTQDTLADAAPIPEWAEAAVVSNLAMRLAGRFNVLPPAVLPMAARDGDRLITRTFMNLKLDNVDMTHLPLGSGRQSRYDIERDL